MKPNVKHSNTLTPPPIDTRDDPKNSVSGTGRIKFTLTPSSNRKITTDLASIKSSRSSKTSCQDVSFCLKNGPDTLVQKQLSLPPLFTKNDSYEPRSSEIIKSKHEELEGIRESQTAKLQVNRL